MYTSLNIQFLNKIRASKSLNLSESICICNRFDNVFDMYIQIHAWDLCLLKDITSNTLVFTANLSDIGVGTYWPYAVESCVHTIDLEIFVAKIYLEFA